MFSFIQSDGTRMEPRRRKCGVRAHEVSSAAPGGQTEMSPLLFGLTVVINSVCIKHSMLFTPKTTIGL